MDSRRIGGWAIAVQVAFSLCLVNLAMLFGGTLLHLFTASSGFRLQDAAAATVDLTSLKTDKEQRKALSGNLLAAVNIKPGVLAVGYASPLPLSNFLGTYRMFSVDRNHVVHSDRSLLYVSASSGYFAAAVTHIISGKPDRAPPDAPRTCALRWKLAQQFSPGEDPIGQLIYSSTAGKPDGTVIQSKDSRRVVVITREAKYLSLDKPAPLVV